MYLSGTKPMTLRTVYSNNQYNTLNANNLGGAANNSSRVLIYNLFRCQTRISDRCVVPTSYVSIRHIIRVFAFCAMLIKRIDQFRI